MSLNMPSLETCSRLAVPIFTVGSDFFVETI